MGCRTYGNVEPAELAVAELQGITNGNEDEEKKWEEEHFKKGLGRRIDGAST